MRKEKKNIYHNPYFLGIFALFSCFLWGSAFPAVKIGYELFEVNTTSEKITFAGIRFLIAAILIFAFVILSKRKIKVEKMDLRGLLLLGLAQTSVQYVFFYIGLSNTSGTKSSILAASNTLFSVLLVQFFFKEDKLSTKKLLGLLLGFAGVVLVNLSDGNLQTGFRITGDGFVLISSLVGAIAGIYTKKLTKDIDSFLIAGYQLFLGSLFLIAAGLVGGGSNIVFTSKGSILLLYMGFISAAAFSIWTILLKYNDVSKVTIYKFTIPLFGVLLSYIFLGERLVGANIIGSMALVSLSIILISR